MKLKLSSIMQGILAVKTFNNILGGNEMHLTELASQIVETLIPYFSVGSNEFAKQAGKAAFEKIKLLWNNIKLRFTSDIDAKDKLNCFESKPDMYRDVLKAILADRMAKYKAFCNELEQLLIDIRPQLKVIQEMKIGEQIVGIDADEISNSKVDVKQKIDDAKDVTGIQVRKLGS